MNKIFRVKAPIVFALLLFISVSCATLFTDNHEPFSISDVYYRSWVIKDIEKGTDVFIKLKDVDTNVDFTSIVFRGIETDIQATVKNGVTLLKATINTGPSLIENYEYKVEDAGDMLKFTYKGSKFSYPLINIRRESTEFIKE